MTAFCAMCRAAVTAPCVRHPISGCGGTSTLPSRCTGTSHELCVVCVCVYVISSSMSSYFFLNCYYHRLFSSPSPPSRLTFSYRCAHADCSCALLCAASLLAVDACVLDLLHEPVRERGIGGGPAACYWRCVCCCCCLFVVSCLLFVEAVVWLWSAL